MTLKTQDWGFHGGEDSYCGLLGCNTMLSLSNCYLLK